MKVQTLVDGCGSSPSGRAAGILLLAACGAAILATAASAGGSPAHGAPRSAQPAASLPGSCAQEVGQVLASDGAYRDELGWSVDLAGTVAVAGAWRANAVANLSGAAYVLRSGPGGWGVEQKLTPAGGQLAEFFGWSVAIDGDTVAIGAVSDAGAAPDGGSVYVYRFQGGSWQQEAELFASDADQGDHFGVSVALDGDTLLVGADLDDDNGTWSGSAYVFRRAQGVWTETQKLQPSTAASYDHFGYSVDLDGDLAVIGAYGSDDFRGALYVFRTDGASWTEEARRVGSQTVGGDFFAASVAVSGERVIAGARWADIGVLDTGEAYVFRRDGGAWVEEQRLTEESPQGGDGFGYCVDLADDLALVGAHNRDVVGPHSGEAVLFRRSGGVWRNEQRLIPSDAETNDLFGLSVSIDGGSALVGAPWDDDQAEDAGSVYAYDVAGCRDCPPPATFCQAAANSTGAAAAIGSSGSTSVGADDLVLLATSCPPNVLGRFFYGPNEATTGTPFGNGWRCVGDPFFRLPAFHVTASGTASFALDHDALPPGGTIAPGSVWRFQHWYRDPAAGGANFNTSDGLRATFCP